MVDNLSIKQCIIALMSSHLVIITFHSKLQLPYLPPPPPPAPAVFCKCVTLPFTRNLFFLLLFILFYLHVYFAFYPKSSVWILVRACPALVEPEEPSKRSLPDLRGYETGGFTFLIIEQPFKNRTGSYFFRFPNFYYVRSVIKSEIKDFSANAFKTQK